MKQANDGEVAKMKQRRKRPPSRRLGAKKIAVETKQMEHTTVEAGHRSNAVPQTSDCAGNLCVDGLSRNPDFLRETELRIRMAVHEAAHTVVRLRLGLGKVYKISIDPEQGGSVAWTMPELQAQTEELLTAILIAAYSGRAAEEEILLSVTAGSGGSEESDLATATALALEMETILGFSKKMPLLYRKVPDPASSWFTDAELTARVYARLDSAYVIARKMVVMQRAAIDFLVETLLALKTLEGPELDAVLDQVMERIVVPPD